MRSLTVFLLISSFFIGCKKYEEGPTLSLRSEERRLHRKWRIVETTAHDSTVFGLGSKMLGLRSGTYWDIKTTGPTISFESSIYPTDQYNSNCTPADFMFTSDDNRLFVTYKIWYPILSGTTYW